MVLAIVLSKWSKYWTMIHYINKLGRFQWSVTRMLRIQAVLKSYNEASSKNLKTGLSFEN